MAGYSNATDLQAELRDRGIKVKKTKSTVLFRRGQKASGLFIVLSGMVSVDLGNWLFAFVEMWHHTIPCHA